MFSTIDKENNGQLGVAARLPAAGLRSGPVGKTFHSSSVQPVQRKVFGDVNTRNFVPHTPLGKQPLQQKPRGSMIKTEQLPKVTNERASQKISKHVEKMVVPPIETMHIWKEEDTFEDIWPSAERPATYIEAFREWRPVSMLPLPCRSCCIDKDAEVIDGDWQRDISERNESVEQLEDFLSLEDLGLNLNILELDAWNNFDS